jgi:hypothetical protein
MTFRRTPLPHDNVELRRAIYDGALRALPTCTASSLLVDDVLALLHRELGEGDVRITPRTLDPEDFFHRMGRIRKTLFLDDRFHHRVRDVLASCGFDPTRVAFDPLRLRVIADRGHENPRAAPVYYPHRDTWYAHSQSIITWWIPLHDLREDETFVVYPDHFRRAVPNDSEVFDYDAWVAKGWSLKIGWQDLEAGRTARYPTVLGQFDPGTELGFACTRGENLLFSGSHFHRTRPQSTGLCRYSLDFRIVHLDDHAAGVGAPNVDNRSRGSALVDYTLPAPVDG